MTAQDAATPAEVPADGRDERQTPSAGERLRAARETRGLSVAAVADGLRLKPEQIDALERDEHDSFPAAIFVTGYIRAYARLLDIDPEPLLIGVRAPETAPAQPIRSAAGGVRRRRDVQPLMALLVLLLAVVFVLAAVVLWLRGGDAVPPAPAWREDAAAIDAPGMPEEAPGDFDAAALADTQARIAAEEAEALGAPVAAPAVPEPGEAVVEDVLVLRFSGRSWVEVSDAGGRRLVVRMGEAGEMLTLQGRAPFDIVLGNAPNVTLEYNGSPYTSIPVSRQNVANFRLGGNNEQ